MDYAADSGTADKREMGENQLSKCKGFTVGNMESKHMEDGPTSDNWNSFKSEVVPCIRRAQAGLQ
jgi:hypothetical protein